MPSIVAYIASVLALTASIVKSIALRKQPRSTSRGYLTAATVAFSAAMIAAAPATLAMTATHGVDPQFTQWTGSCFAMFAAASLLAALLHGTKPPDKANRATRHQMIAAAFSATGMLVLLMFSDHRCCFSPQREGPTSLLYMAVNVAYMSAVLGRFAYLIQRDARTARQDLRRGVQVTESGAVFGLLWAAWKIAGLVAIISLGHALPNQTDITIFLAITTITLITAGSTCPLWEEQLRQRRARKFQAVLEPLHTQLTTALPQVRLPTALSDDDDVTFTLYRQIIEIRDAQLALRPYVPPALSQQATILADQYQLAPKRKRLLIEAAELVTGLDESRSGNRYPSNTPLVVPPATSVDIWAEAAWLRNLARTIDTSPHLAQLRRFVHASYPQLT